MYSVSNIPLLKDLMAAVVAAIRPVGAISSIEETSGDTKVFSENNLSEGDVVSMDNTDYVLLSATDEYFIVEGTGIVATEWSGLAPYFTHGHLEEITQKLKEKDESDKYRYQKFPLIVLIEDIPKSVTTDLPKSVYAEANSNVLIMNYSEREWDAPDRYAENFEPVLIPIYVDFMNQIVDSNLFDIDLDEIIPHNPINRLAWGKESLYGNDGDITDDHIDAIELENMVLRMKFNCLNE